MQDDQHTAEELAHRQELPTTESPIAALASLQEAGVIDQAARREYRRLAQFVASARRLYPKLHFQQSRDALVDRVNEATSIEVAQADADTIKASADALTDAINELKQLDGLALNIIEKVSLDRFHEGAEQVPFERSDLEDAARTLGVRLPKNIGDVVYSLRYRAPLPRSVQSKAPTGKQWVIWARGRSKYVFVAPDLASIILAPGYAERKILDSTPGVIEHYAFTDEQALLVKIRYNRLVDIFTGVTCYSLQNHLRTSVKDIGQVETDEIYVGIDKRGAHYVLPVQAKRGRDTLSIVQIWQDVSLCKEKFPGSIIRPIAAQVISQDASGTVLHLFEFTNFDQDVKETGIKDQQRYRLVPHRPGEPRLPELAQYRAEALQDLGR